jgi:hypothetical protein
MQRRLLVGALVAAGALAALAGTSASAKGNHVVRAAAPAGAIEHVVVIDLENENYADTFGPNSPATYLNGTLLKKGELVPNYYGTSHASLGNYLSQVSGQATTPTINNDCIDLSLLPNLKGGFLDVRPGTDAPGFPGLVAGDGCVFPKPTLSSHGARTIGDQLEAARDEQDAPVWREYAEDMGNDPARDYGTPDPLGGTDCAHPAIGGVDVSNGAAANDQYATRHNPFVYFHSVIDDAASCARHVVPLGTVTVGSSGAPDVFSGHLARDLRHEDTTPAFSFITPNLCTDGHDAKCVGVNTEGGKAGGLVGADLWLKHWMPLILGSPAYRDGSMLVVVTFDEANPVGAVGDSRACCNQVPGPNISNSGFSPLIALFGLQKTPAPGTFPYPGGGQVGAVLFNRELIVPGSVNTTGSYNHFSALRSYEDLLGLRRGGDDGLGHLGMAARADVVPFGRDVFNAER